MAEYGLDLLEPPCRRIASGVIHPRQLDSIGCDPEYYAGCIDEINPGLFELLTVYPYRDASDFSSRISVDSRYARVVVRVTGGLRVSSGFRSIGRRFCFRILIGC